MFYEFIIVPLLCLFGCCCCCYNEESIFSDGDGAHTGCLWIIPLMFAAARHQATALSPWYGKVSAALRSLKGHLSNESFMAINIIYFCDKCCKIWSDYSFFFIDFFAARTPSLGTFSWLCITVLLCFFSFSKVSVFMFASQIVQPRRLAITVQCTPFALAHHSSTPS